MSHYAQTVELMPAHTLDGFKTVVPTGVEVKNIECVDGGYTFDAHIAGEWQSLGTSEDLPAFTDRGRAHRADRDLPIHPALRRGKPPAEHATKTYGLRFTDAQWEWLKYRGKLRKISASEFVRDVLQRRGMP